MEFVLGGAAAMGACLFTNPLEVLKTRMQLQGELKARGQHAVFYKNVFHAAYVVAKNDGLLALQKGLVPALGVQLVINGSRLGVYGYASSSNYLKDDNDRLIVSRLILVTGGGAAIGHFLASPLFLIKTQLQSQATESIAVGHQHNRTSAIKALVDIYTENGIRGLFRGATSIVPRGFFGGSAQLISFEYAKQLIKTHGVTDSPLLLSFSSSMIAGVIVSVIMAPLDLLITRLYNQPIDVSGKGLLYDNYFDCIKKIYKTEGVTAYFKGIGPLYFRLGPHTVLSLVFFDQLRALAAKYHHREEKSNIKDS